MIDEGRIVEVGPGLDGDEMVDCSGHAVLPGFIDSHVRFMVNGQLDPMYSGDAIRLAGEPDAPQGTRAGARQRRRDQGGDERWVLSPRDDPRYGHFRDAELAVLVEEATAAGRIVMARAQATDGIKAAIRNGIRSIEHGIHPDDEAIGMMLERGMHLVPTLMAIAPVRPDPGLGPA